MDILTSLNFWLWVAAAVLAALMLFAGYAKLTWPLAKLDGMMKWPSSYPRLTRFVGTVDAAGGLGLILPLATGILPWLTPLAAIGIVVLQLLAIGFHARRGETAQTLGLNLVLLALAIFVAWGRWGLFGG